MIPLEFKWNYLGETYEVKEIHWAEPRETGLSLTMPYASCKNSNGKIVDLTSVNFELNLDSIEALARILETFLSAHREES